VLIFYSCEKSISIKNTVLPIEKFPSLVLSRGCDNATTPYDPLLVLLSVKWLLTEG